MAGISAAKRLSDAGVSNVLIIEGRSEIGGRIRSKLLEYSNVRIELGANWIEILDWNNLDSHPLWRLAKQCGGLGGNFQDSVIFGTIHAFDDTGRNITVEKKFLSRLKDWKTVNEKIKSHLLTKKANPTYTVDISARQALKQFGWIPKSDIDKAIEWLEFDWNFACPPENASFLLNFPLPRDYMYFVTDQKQGYAKLVHCLADSFLAPHDDRLHLNTAIQEVDWDNNCVCVTVTKYQSNHKYCATSAILTFSVGVLKNNHIKFNPILPSSKLAAISKFGVGYYLKVFLEFSETFWGKDDVSTILHVSTKKGYYVHFQSLMQNLHGKPPILIATLTGESVCNLSSNDIKYQVVQVLIKIFGPSVPEPTAVTIPDWCNNPLYYGMFSYPSYKFTKLDFHSLQVNAGCLYFAGEAFVKDGEAGFVHSALKSGIETADEILNRFH